MTSRTLRKPTKRDMAERVSRCVSTMVYYQMDGWSRSGATLLAEEADCLLTWAAEAGLGDRLGDSVLSPLRGELIDRYGLELGARLHEEFLRAVGHSSGPGPTTNEALPLPPRRPT